MTKPQPSEDSSRDQVIAFGRARSRRPFDLEAPNPKVSESASPSWLASVTYASVVYYGHTNVKCKVIKAKPTHDK